jgi:hypothetical protein
MVNMPDHPPPVTEPTAEELARRLLEIVEVHRVPATPLRQAATILSRSTETAAALVCLRGEVQWVLDNYQKEGMGVFLALRRAIAMPLPELASQMIARLTLAEEQRDASVNQLEDLELAAEAMLDCTDGSEREYLRSEAEKARSLVALHRAKGKPHA